MIINPNSSFALDNIEILSILNGFLNSTNSLGNKIIPVERISEIGIPYMPKYFTNIASNIILNVISIISNFEIIEMTLILFNIKVKNLDNVWKKNENKHKIVNKLPPNDDLPAHITMKL